MGRNGHNHQNNASKLVINMSMLLIKSFRDESLTINLPKLEFCNLLMHGYFSETKPICINYAAKLLQAILDL